MIVHDQGMDPDGHGIQGMTHTLVWVWANQVEGQFRAINWLCLGQPK